MSITTALLRRRWSSGYWKWVGQLPETLPLLSWTGTRSRNGTFPPTGLARRPSRASAGRLREFLPRLGIDASTWSDERLDTVFDGYLAAYEAAWRPYPDAAPCLEVLRHVVSVAALSNGDQAQQEAKGPVPV